MTSYPIQVEPLSEYYGDDPAKQRKYDRDLQTAKKIEEFINRKIEIERSVKGSVMILFATIANALNLSTITVEKYLVGFSGSTNNSILIHFDEE